MVSEFKLKVIEALKTRIIAAKKYFWKKSSRNFTYNAERIRDKWHKRK